MTEEHNLFSDLWRWADKQDENFTTEGLVYVIRRLIAHSPSHAYSLISTITNGKVGSKQLSGAEIRVHSQFLTENHGIPDIWIESSNVDVAIEIKLGAPLGFRQLESYRMELSLRRKETQVLVLISKFKGDEDSTKEADVSIRWFELADFLLNLVQDAQLDAISRFIVEEYCGYLMRRRLAFVPIKSNISRGIRNHLSSGTSIFDSRVRSIDKLHGIEELNSFHDLFILMQTAIDSCGVDEALIFDSGQKPNPWIGFNLLGMKYFFYVNLSDPETLILETSYRFEMDPAKYKSLDVGKFYRKGEIDFWERTMDLLDPNLDFFSLSSEDQLSAIESFLSENIERSLLLEHSA